MRDTTPWWISEWARIKRPIFSFIFPLPSSPFISTTFRSVFAQIQFNYFRGASGFTIASSESDHRDYTENNNRNRKIALESLDNHNDGYYTSLKDPTS